MEEEIIEKALQCCRRSTCVIPDFLWPYLFNDDNELNLLDTMLEYYNVLELYRSCDIILELITETKHEDYGNMRYRIFSHDISFINCKCDWAAVLRFYNGYALQYDFLAVSNILTTLLRDCKCYYSSSNERCYSKI